MRRSFDEPAALMVEEVLREMFMPYHPERRVLQAYYAENMTLDEIGKEIGISDRGVGQHRRPMAERIFSEQWALLIRNA